MTVVECFNNSPIDDLISCLAWQPQRIIFLGDGVRMKNGRCLYERFVQQFGMATVLEFRDVNTRDWTAIVNILEEIVRETEEIVFDLTGGQETLLAAIGLIYERYRSQRKIHLRRFCVQQGTVYDVVSGELQTLSKRLQLSASQLVQLYGGVIGGSPDGGTVVEWEFSPSLAKVIDDAWSICRADPSRWNTQVSRLCEMEKYRATGSGALRTVIDETVVSRHIERYAEKRMAIQDFLRDLERVGLIELQSGGKRVEIIYASPLVKRCLEKAGNLLEWKVLHLAHTMTDETGLPFFSDCQQGVYIDWDGHFRGKEARFGTLNEIDVLLMHGVIPVFISCKNGTVDDDELYKLSVVAERFGGPYAKKVLVATYVERNLLVRAHLMQRAKDMGIHFIADVHNSEDSEWIRKLRDSVL